MPDIILVAVQRQRENEREKTGGGGVKIPKHSIWNSIKTSCTILPVSTYSPPLHQIPGFGFSFHTPVVCLRPPSAWKALHQLLCLLRLLPLGHPASASAVHLSAPAGTLVGPALHSVAVSCPSLSPEYELLGAGARSISIFLHVILASSTYLSTQQYLVNVCCIKNNSIFWEETKENKDWKRKLCYH